MSKLGYYSIISLLTTIVPCKLHAHSVQYAHKLVTTRRANENNSTSHSQVLEQGASSNPPDPR
eukprot:1151637-Pelagomonas_calceolata.AAC.3